MMSFLLGQKGSYIKYQCFTCYWNNSIIVIYCYGSSPRAIGAAHRLIAQEKAWNAFFNMAKHFLGNKRTMKRL